MMHQTLDELMAVRQALLGSDDASLAQLRQVDRRLVARAERGDAAFSVARELSGESLAAAGEAACHGATLWLEIAIALDGIRARPVLDELAQSEPGKALCWWLAANYPGLALPDGFPDTPELQVLAARATGAAGRVPYCHRPGRSGR